MNTDEEAGMGVEAPSTVVQSSAVAWFSMK